MSNLTDGKIIKHSHLYPLQPNNIGKARVERFSGYISRLSASHHFIVSTLVTKIIQPLYSSGPSSKKNHSCDLLKNASSSINGTEKWAIDIVDILTELTGSSNLRFTTLQIWGNILPVKGLLRKYQAWCPYCYQELLDSGEIIYEPLISALEVIKICEVHRCELTDFCPNCKKPQLFLARSSRPGYCSFCHTWLGSKMDKNINALEDQKIVKSLWVCENIGCLLSLAPKLIALPSSEILHSNIRNILDEVFGGSITDFSRIIGKHSRTIRDWGNGTQHPTISSLLELCSLFGVSLTDLILKKDVTFTPTFQEIDMNKPSKVVHTRNFNFENLEIGLRKIIESDDYPPPSLREAAKRLDHDPSHLMKLFPTLCQKISGRFEEYRGNQKKENAKNLRSEIRNTAIFLHESSTYPSIHWMGKTLKKPGIMRSPVAISAYYEILEELGYKGEPKNRPNNGGVSGEMT